MELQLVGILVRVSFPSQALQFLLELTIGRDGFVGGKIYQHFATAMLHVKAIDGFNKRVLN